MIVKKKIPQRDIKIMVKQKKKKIVFPYETKNQTNIN